MKSSTFHFWYQKKKNGKQLTGLILKVYFGIDKTQNMINITCKLSLLKDNMWKCYKIYYVKFTVVLSGKLWEIIIRENKGILLTYSDINLTVFFQIINMLILHAKNFISNMTILLISFRDNLLEKLELYRWTH